MKPIVKIAKVIARILEITHWVGTALMAVATVCSLAAPSLVKHFIGYDAKECCGAALNVYGFEVVAPVTDGEIPMKTLFLFGIGAVILFVLMAMIFRNLYLIIKKSEASTPFQPDNIRMLREIGIFSIAMPIVGWIMSAVCRLVLGTDVVETSVNMYGFSMGIILLCLTQFFIHGAELEKEVDGLL